MTNPETNNEVFSPEVVDLAEKIETLCYQDKISYRIAMLAIALLAIKMGSDMLEKLSEKEVLRDLQVWANLITSCIPFTGETP